MFPKAHSTLLIAIFVIAALSRFALLDSIAPGIHPDEAMNGNEGLYAVTTGSPQLFYPANFGREGFFVNLVGTSVWAFGPNRFGLRFWSALIGLAAIPLIYGLGRELFSRNVGLWSAFFLATSFWHLNFSRIAFRAILVPTLLLAAFYGLLRARRTVRWQWAVAGGLAFGLGFHSYIAFRIAPFVAMVLLRKPLALSALWTASASP